MLPSLKTEKAPKTIAALIRHSSLSIRSQKTWAILGDSFRSVVADDHGGEAAVAADNQFVMQPIRRDTHRAQQFDHDTTFLSVDAELGSWHCTVQERLTSASDSER